MVLSNQAIQSRPSARYAAVTVAVTFGPAGSTVTGGADGWPGAHDARRRGCPGVVSAR